MKLNALAVACLAASVLSAAPKTVAPESALRDVQAAAYRAADNAFRLQSFVAMNEGDWQTHVSEVRALASAVNDMGRSIAAFEQNRDSATPAERAAIDRIKPYASCMAAYTTTVISRLRTDPRDFWQPAYRGVIDNIVRDSQYVSDTLGSYLKLETARTKEKHLEQSLGIEAGY